MVCLEIYAIHCFSLFYFCLCWSFLHRHSQPHQPTHPPQPFLSLSINICIFINKVTLMNKWYDYVVFILCIESTLCVNDQVDFVCEMLVHLLIIIWNVQHWFVVQNSVLYLMSKESLTVPLVWIKSVFSHISFYFEVWGNNAHMTSRTFTSRT